MAKYQTIYQQLRLAILRGKYAPNASLPSESAVAIKYGVSRITAKRALNELAAAELVYRIQGKGTFVKAHQKTPPNQILLVLPTPADIQYQLALEAALHGTSWQLQVITTTAFATLTLAQLTAQFAGVCYYLDDLPNALPALMALAVDHFPLVVLNQQPAALPVPSVISDHIAGGRLACQYLQRLQHTRIAFLTGTPFWQTFTGPISDRFMGYVSALAQPAATATPLRWAQALQHSQAGDQLRTYLTQQQITAIVTATGDDRQHLSPLTPTIARVTFNTTRDPAALATLVPDYSTLSQQAIALLLSQINNPHCQQRQQVTVANKLLTSTATY